MRKCSLLADDIEWRSNHENDVKINKTKEHMTGRVLLYALLDFFSPNWLPCCDKNKYAFIIYVTFLKGNFFFAAVYLFKLGSFKELSIADAALNLNFEIKFIPAFVCCRVFRCIIRDLFGTNLGPSSQNPVL